MDQLPRPQILPPLEWLRVFEAAARLENFSNAARELGLTQAAVSQRIRNLEGRLGKPLFTRLPRGVELTVEGEAYAPPCPISPNRPCPLHSRSVQSAET